LIIPALFDMTETSLKNVTLTLISASITQMFRSSVLVFSATLAWIFLKKRLYRHHIVAICAVIIGIVMGGLS
jgi:drug/metabolite transporter (DMT)-like permease